MKKKVEKIDFELLVKNVEHVHSIANTSATCAVNQLNAIRNWAIGYYIVEFEQRGNNRVAYGEKLLKRHEERLNLKGMNQMLFFIDVGCSICDIRRFVRQC